MQRYNRRQMGEDVLGGRGSRHLLWKAWPIALVSMFSMLSACGPSTRDGIEHATRACDLFLQGQVDGAYRAGTIAAAIDPRWNGLSWALLIIKDARRSNADAQAHFLKAVQVLRRAREEKLPALLSAS